MFLHATTLADISTVDGIFFTKDAWKGIPEGSARNPIPMTPSPLLPCGLRVQVMAKSTNHISANSRKPAIEDHLGAWLLPPPLQWKWFYSRIEDRVYAKKVRSGNHTKGSTVVQDNVEDWDITRPLI
jgi:hypothetical protein